MSFIIGHSNGKCLSDYIAKDFTYDCTTNEEDAGGQSQSKSVITFSDFDLLVRWINGELATKPLYTNVLVGAEMEIKTSKKLHVRRHLIDQRSLLHAHHMNSMKGTTYKSP